MLKVHLRKDISLKGTCSSGADDDCSDHVGLRVVMCQLRYSVTDIRRSFNNKRIVNTQRLNVRSENSGFGAALVCITTDSLYTESS